MGFLDSQENIKDSVNSGNVSNNVIVNDNAHILLTLLGVITVIKIVELACIFYTSHVRKLRKRYNNGSNNPA